MIAFALTALSWITLPVPSASAQGVRYETGISVFSGEYGTAETTTSVTWSHGVAVEWRRLTLRATMPVVAQRGSAVLSAGGTVPGHGGGGDGRMGGGGMGRALSTDTSVDEYRVRAGDPHLTASLRVFQSMGTSVSAGASVKAPVSEAGDIGTGEWDAGAMLDVSRHVTGPWFVAAGGAWWKLGDPDSLDLRDPVLGTLMLSRIGEGGGAALTLAAASSTLDGFDPPVSCGALVSRDLWGGRAAVSAMIGLTDSAADFGVGLSWGVDLR